MTVVPTGNTYDKYASSNPIERRLMSGFLTTLDAALPAEASTILEVGIGEGEIMQRLRHRYPTAGVAGLDLPDPELQAEWRRLDLAAGIADATALPFPDATFDLCLAIEVLEHVDDPDAMLREIARVTSGSVVVSVPREPLWRALNMARGAYLRDLGNTPGHVNHWSRSGFRDLVSKHFDVGSIASPTPWTVIGAVSRTSSSRRSGS